MAVRVTRRDIATARGVGSPDYAAPKPVGQVPVGPVYTSTDIAELAARLGSIVTFDRRGNVIWLDDFENGVSKWYHDIIDVGGSVDWSNERARNGGYSAKLTTGPALNAAVAIGVLRPFPVLGNLGVEASFSFNDKVADITIRGDLYDGSYLHRARVRYWTATGRAQYYDAAGLPQNLAPAITLQPSLTLFHTIKLVTNYIAGEYMRLILNNTVFDLSGLTYRKAVSGVAPHLYMYVYVMNNAAVQAIAHIDDAIITQNEPSNPQ